MRETTPASASSGASEAIGHIPALDGLRGIAIGLVLWHHAPDILGFHLYRSRFWVSSKGGWLGVDLFFVISGFLITSILLRTRGKPDALKTFWIRRAFRIFPAFYLYISVAALCLFTYIGFSPDDPLGRDPRPWLPYLFYLGNFEIMRTTYPIGELAILWSLAIEEQFYLVWPMVVLSLPLRRIAVVCAYIITLAPLVRIAMALTLGPRGIYVFTLGRADTLITGALLALLLARPARRDRVLQWARRLALPALLILLYTVWVPYHVTKPGQCPRYWVVIGYTWVALSCAVLVALTVKASPLVRLVLANRPLMALGRISYGVYLWHFLVGDLMNTFLKNHHLELTAPIKGILWIALSITAASLSWHLFEKRILKYKNRFAYRVSPSPTET